MSKTTTSRFHVIPSREKVDALQEVISLLRKQAANSTIRRVDVPTPKFIGTEIHQ
jgi:hypothetical protein